MSTDELDDTMCCNDCGQHMCIEANGVSHHLDEDGEIDYDTDADHVAVYYDEDDWPNLL